MTAHRPARTCPDCADVPVDTRMKHAATCPLAVATDEVMAADRGWFEAHPRAHHRRRPITPANITDLRLAGYIPDGWTTVGDIKVIELGPGVRARSHRNIRIVPMHGAT